MHHHTKDPFEGICINLVTPYNLKLSTWLETEKIDFFDTMDGSEKSVDPGVSQTPDAKLQSSKVTNTKSLTPIISILLWFDFF